MRPTAAVGQVSDGLTSGIFKSNAAFFRRGSSGAGREILSGAELAAYQARAAALAPRDMLAWLYSPRQEPGSA